MLCKKRGHSGSLYFNCKDNLITAEVIISYYGELFRKKLLFSMHIFIFIGLKMKIFIFYTSSFHKIRL